MKKQIIFTKQEAIDALHEKYQNSEDLADIEIIIQEHGLSGIGATIPNSKQHAFGCLCSICNNLLAHRVTC